MASRVTRRARSVGADMAALASVDPSASKSVREAITESTQELIERLDGIAELGRARLRAPDRELAIEGICEDLDELGRDILAEFLPEIAAAIAAARALLFDEHEPTPAP